MKLGRRSFLQMMPTAAVAVRSGAEAIARDLSKVEIAGIGTGSYNTAAVSPSAIDEDRAFARALNIPWMRSQIESLMYENNRCVSRIDPDIAVLRSFSLNAKIAFQRQRNVAHDLKMKTGEWNWPYEKMLRLVGLK